MTVGPEVRWWCTVFISCLVDLAIHEQYSFSQVLPDSRWETLHPGDGPNRSRVVNNVLPYDNEDEVSRCWRCTGTIRGSDQRAPHPAPAEGVPRDQFGTGQLLREEGRRL